MPIHHDQERIINDVVNFFPFPIAVTCRRYAEDPPDDLWREWEVLSRDILQSILIYLSHLLLSDLVATGKKSPHLFHRIQSILSRPMAGHYAGFLRETAIYYRDEELSGSVPELIDFLFASEVEKSVLDTGKPLIGLLVDYRNLWAHGRIDHTGAIHENVNIIREVTIKLLQALSFLKHYPLSFEDGSVLMGANPDGLSGKGNPIMVITASGLQLRPLLLKLKNKDLVLLEDLDLKRQRMVYRGTSTYEQFTKKQIKKGAPAKLFEDLAALLDKVRSIEAVLPLSDWVCFRERAGVITERTLSHYTDMRKFLPQFYVSRPQWDGEGSVLNRFLESDKTLLAISGEQGTGKSALVANLAQNCREEGHAVLFFNAQRFTFADVNWSGNPYPDYFATALHYEGGFDKAGFARLIKSGAQDKKVIFFIDAINEVDGLKNKWNRFRAMDLMLAWIAEIAQPGLKIILSFRLDVYEKFEYLQPDELPPNLTEISWPGNNPHKPWVTDLEPFNEVQAEALFEKLQAEPQFGMSPDMTWHKIREGLGDQHVEFTSNPLIFSIFLISHNQLKDFISNDKEDLFIKYAAKLTGTNEIEKWPWWKKAWGFLKNGNITSKEQFISDMIEKMSEEGGTAFLVDNLAPNNKKRDRRLLATIESQHDYSLQELTESGLVVEEKIELQKEKDQVVSRRITFVSELMLTAMENISDKVFRKDQLKSIVFSALLWSMCVSIIIVLLQVLKLTAFYILSEKVGANLSTEMIGFTISWALKITIWFPMISFFVFVIRTVSDYKETNVRKVGIYEEAFLKQIEMDKAKDVIRFWLSFCVPIVIVALILVAKWIMQEAEGYPDIPSLLLLGMTAILIVIFITNIFTKISIIDHSSRIVKSSVKRKIAYLESPYIKEKEIRSSKIRLIGICSIIAFGFIYIYWITAGNDTATGDLAVSYKESHMIPFINGMKWYVNDLFLVGYILYNLTLFLFIGVLPLYQIFFYKRTLKLYYKYASGSERIKNGFTKLIIISYTFCFFLVFSFGIVDYLKTRTNDKSIIESLKLSEKNYSINKHGQFSKLNLEQYALSLGHIQILSTFNALEELVLPNQQGINIDLKRYKLLKTLTAPGYLIAESSYRFSLFPEIMSMTILDPMDGFGGRLKEKGLYIVDLSFKGKCSTLSYVPKSFPRLRTLAIEEKIGRNTKNNFPEQLQPNLRLIIDSQSPPMLDWLGPMHTRYIIVLKTPPDEHTQNLQIIERLWTDVGKLEPMILRKAESLKWLFLTFEKPKTAAWYNDLYKTVQSHLPELKTLELMTKDNVKSLRSARGREKILAMLKELIAKPDIIGQVNGI